MKIGEGILCVAQDPLGGAEIKSLFSLPPTDFACLPFQMSLQADV